MREAKKTVVILPLLFVLVACAGSATPTRDEESSEESLAIEHKEADAQPLGGASVEANFSLVQDEPVLALGAVGEWDSGVLRFPYVLQYNDQFHMFYEARLPFDPNENLPVAIGYASSEDGIDWIKSDLNPILQGDGSGFDSASVSRPLVSVDENGIWLMYYAGEGEANRVGIGLASASSPTGPWERADAPLIVDGPEGAWDDQMVLADQIIQSEEGYRMYYSGREASGHPAMIGLAMSEDGLTWEKFNDPTNDDTSVLFTESDPVLPNGRGWDSRATWTPSILEHENRWTMVYNAFGSLGAAISDDGIIWEKYEGNPILRDSSLFHPFLLTNDDGSYWVYFRDLRDESIYLMAGTLAFE